MSFSTLLSYLVGNRQAIVRIAATPHAVWLGFLFVISAGFAREYDGEDLTREPWHVLLPLGASLVTSFLLFCLVYGNARNRGSSNLGFWVGYRSFLSLYWMTVPIAWLYAIPVERFASAAEGVRFNLTLLAIVSLWRVLLMTRVVEVLYGFPKFVAFFLVMLFADAVALAVLWFTPLPIFNIMGGIRMTESESIIRATATTVAVFGTLLLPIWLIGLGVSIAATVSRRTERENFNFEEKSPGANDVSPLRVDTKIWILAAVSIVIWGAILPVTQPEQQLRCSAEQALHAGHIAEAIDFMSKYDRSKFPPHWDPPPRIAYPNPHPPLIDVLETIANRGAAPWVRKIYFEKLQAKIDHNHAIVHLLRNRDGKLDSRLLHILSNSPEGFAFVKLNARHFEIAAAHELESSDPAAADRIQELLTRVENAAPESDSPLSETSPTP